MWVSPSTLLHLIVKRVTVRRTVKIGPKTGALVLPVTNVHIDQKSALK